MVKITKEMRYLIEDMVQTEKTRHDKPKMSDIKAFRLAYDIWFRTVS